MWGLLLELRHESSRCQSGILMLRNGDWQTVNRKQQAVSQEEWHSYEKLLKSSALGMGRCSGYKMLAVQA